jgi:hypothetical protein
MSDRRPNLAKPYYIPYATNTTPRVAVYFVNMESQSWDNSRVRAEIARRLDAGAIPYCESYQYCQGPLPLVSYLINRTNHRELRGILADIIPHAALADEPFGDTSDHVGRWALGYPLLHQDFEVTVLDAHTRLLELIAMIGERVAEAGTTLDQPAARDYLRNWNDVRAELRAPEDAKHYTALLATAIFSHCFVMYEHQGIRQDAWVVGLSLACIPQAARDAGRLEWQRWCKKTGPYATAMPTVSSARHQALLAQQWDRYRNPQPPPLVAQPPPSRPPPSHSPPRRDADASSGEVTFSQSPIAYYRAKPEGT